MDVRFHQGLLFGEEEELLLQESIVVQEKIKAQCLCQKCAIFTILLYPIYVRYNRYF